MSIELQIGLDAIVSYKRLAYTPWHAIAEFVDNSTQSYFDNRKILDLSFAERGESLVVSIDYNLEEGLLRISDNAMGMSYEELQHALHVAKPPLNTTGRSKYGMGLKTAACWIGDFWTIRTKKLGETLEHTITVDVKKIANGINELPYVPRHGLSIEEHYTVIEISRHNREFKGRTLSKIRQFLSSMYREDFRNNVLVLIWRGEILKWVELDDRLLKAQDGSLYKQDFEFYVDEGLTETKKKVYGWVGILADGSRSDAGFSIIRSGRVVRGWPESWRPSSLYGQEQGSNDLINQRLVGEVHLDEFDVSHTKDDILWFGDQEEQVEKGLLEHCGAYRHIARTYRKTRQDQRGPNEVETRTAINELKRELESPEVTDLISTTSTLPKILVEQVVKSVKEAVVGVYDETFSATIGSLTIKGYVQDDLSPNDPYITVDATQQFEIIVIVNAAHPHWSQLRGAEGVLNYLRHCTYDALAEWEARKKVSSIDPDTIKIFKDRYLRIPLEIEKHKNESEQEADNR